MAYTSAQLIAAYTAANDGVAPSAATVSILNTTAAQNQAGQITDTGALAFIINSADSTTAVATQAYQFFTGKTPSKAGLDFLVNSSANPTDLNDAYYAQFNIENRYINFAANLGLYGEGAGSFAATYGGLGFSSFVGILYETIIGSARATAFGINVPNAIADIIGRQAAFVQTARDRGLIDNNSTTAQIDIATKAAVVGYLLVEGIKADVGLYAAGSNNFVNALISGTAQYNIDLLSVYSVLGGGVGSPVIPPIVSTNLTVGADNFPGTPGNDVVNGLVYSDSGVAPFVTTFSGIDNLNGGAGTDTLNLQVTRSNNGATGTLSLPVVSVTSFETINIRALSSTPTDIVNVSAVNFGGATAFNSDRSTNTISIANMVTGTSAGIIGGTGVANGDLIFGYAVPIDAATLNLSSGANPGGVTILSAPTAVTVNSNGALANSIGALRLGGLASIVTINAEADLFLGAISGLAGANVGITIAGAAPNAGPGVAPGVTLGVLSANVGSVTASGLTATGITAVIGANPALNLTGGAGADIILVGAGQGAAITGNINGGAGTSDVIAFTTGADLAASSAAKLVGFEALSVSNPGAAATLQAYDVSLLSGVNAYWIGGIGGVGGANTGSIQLNNLPAASNVVAYTNVSGTNAAGALSLRLANAGGSADSVTLQLDNFNTKSAPNVSGISVSSLALGGSTTAGQVETLNIVSAGTITGAGTANAVTLVDSGLAPNFADPNTIKVTGSQALNLTTGLLSHALTLDASAATAGINFSSLAGTTGTAAALSATGTALNDTFTLGAKQIGTIFGGGGGDLIKIGFANQSVTLVYKTAAESLLDLTGTPGLGGTGTMDQVTGFVSGLDKIKLTDLGAGFVGPQVIVDRGAAVSPTDALQLLSNPTLFQDVGGVAHGLVQFDYPSGTILVADVNGNGVYDSGDLVVSLAGVDTLANSDIVGS